MFFAGFKKTKKDENQYMWSKDIDLRSSTNIDDQKYNFICSMLQENLQHARHVENERITYHGFFIALVAGVFAFIIKTGEFSTLAEGDGNHKLSLLFLIPLIISLLLCIILIILGMLTLQLCERWSNAFDRHLEYAKGCYYILHKALFKNTGKDVTHTDLIERLEVEPTPIVLRAEEPLRIDVLPLYCFRIKNPSTAERLQKKSSLLIINARGCFLELLTL